MKKICLYTLWIVAPPTTSAVSPLDKYWLNGNTTTGIQRDNFKTSSASISLNLNFLFNLKAYFMQCFKGFPTLRMLRHGNDFRSTNGSWRLISQKDDGRSPWTWNCCRELNFVASNWMTSFYLDLQLVDKCNRSEGDNEGVGHEAVCCKTSRQGWFQP